MAVDGESARDAYTVCALLYVEEAADDADYVAMTGYRTTIRVEDEIVQRAVIHSLADEAACWPVAPGTYVWQAVEAFVAALPSLRVRSTIDERRSA